MNKSFLNSGPRALVSFISDFLAYLSAKQCQIGTYALFSQWNYVIFLAYITPHLDKCSHRVYNCFGKAIFTARSYSTYYDGILVKDTKAAKPSIILAVGRSAPKSGAGKVYLEGSTH
jgi:hypothetical protein